LQLCIGKVPLSKSGAKALFFNGTICAVPTNLELLLV